MTGIVTQAFGYTTLGYGPEKQFLLNTSSVSSGKYGYFICDAKLDGISPVKRELQFKILLEIHKMLQERGDEVTVADVVELYKTMGYE